ncbi:hypothetical protein PC116_g24635 [Phytophthora cactorum]|nr:hypothetical protein Pcac1_g16847 [Phytophthora cactorum]KAG2781767.1 hypothetical protein Pcac1_g8099 [Phytophthora cactorum]KAG2800517.1 hypothetical protein PC112_g20439 [Phytophthora cactorum]KAG2879363.1 hypothetical protein PC114_g22601 [Phytophthora cactorum]KAG3012897.1 hypothetical protein PC120_g13595 [Phytophthora cactorum]
MFGAAVDPKNNYGATPLLIAAMRGNADAFKLLVHEGASINANDHGKRTSLHLAAKNGANDIVKMLVDFEADVKLKDKRGFTPLMAAAQVENVRAIRLLLAHPALAK